jgi:hypothetical protein
MWFFYVRKNLYLIYDFYSPFYRKIYIRLPVRLLLCPIWPPLLPLNLIYISIFFCHCPERTCPIHTSNITSTKSHIHLFSLRSFIQGIRPGSRLLVIFRKKFYFYSEDVLAPRLTPKLEKNALSAVRDCLFTIFVVTSISVGRLVHLEPDDASCDGDKEPTLYMT